MSTEQKDKTVTVSVRTPAGHSHQFELKDNIRISKVIREAVDHFASQGQLEEGDYGLALIRDGRTEELAAGARLSDFDIVDEDTLVLFPRKPQVDGYLGLTG